MQPCRGRPTTPPTTPQCVSPLLPQAAGYPIPRRDLGAARWPVLRSHRPGRLHRCGWGCRAASGQEQVAGPHTGRWAASPCCPSPCVAHIVHARTICMRLFVTSPLSPSLRCRSGHQPGIHRNVLLQEADPVRRRSGRQHWQMDGRLVSRLGRCNHRLGRASLQLLEAALAFCMLARVSVDMRSASDPVSPSLLLPLLATRSFMCASGGRSAGWLLGSIRVSGRGKEQGSAMCCSLSCARHVH